MKENNKSYKLYQGYGNNMTLKTITVPENIEFYASRHDRDDSSVDKDRYDLLAVIPYDEEKMNIISDNIIFDTLINIFDKYIVWQIRDISPIDSDFPITLIAPVIDEIYFKMTKVNDDKLTEALRKENIVEYDHLFDPEYRSAFQNRVNEEFTDPIYYAKIHGITENGYIDVTYNYVKNTWDFSDEMLIRRQIIAIRNIFDKTIQSKYSLIDKQEFDCALNDSLLRLGVMF